MKYLLAVDVETTGLDPVKDEITEIGAVLLNERLETIDSFHSLVGISRHALRRGKKTLIRDKSTGKKVDVFTLTGLDGDLLHRLYKRGGGTPKFIVSGFQDFILRNCPCSQREIVLLGQNVEFDEAFLKALYDRAKHSWPFDYHTIDTASIFFAYYLKQHKSFPSGLGQNKIVRELNIPAHEPVHSAISDILTTIDVLRKLVE
jgi:DNA polymerase III epsilon subunit-like protein